MNIYLNLGMLLLGGKKHSKPSWPNEKNLNNIYAVLVWW